MQQVVRGYIFNEKQQVLLVQHSKKGRWVLPGGHVDLGEGLHTALEREIYEEFGIDIDIIGSTTGLGGASLVEYPLPIANYMITYYSPQYEKELEKHEWIFAARTSDTKLRIQTDEIYHYKRFSIDDILSMDTNTETFGQIPYVLDTNREMILGSLSGY